MSICSSYPNSCTPCMSNTLDYSTYRGLISSVRHVLIDFKNSLPGDDLIPTIADLTLKPETCFWCKQFIGTGDIDHFIPRYRGGKTEICNLMYICSKCNKSKQYKDPEHFAKKVKMSDDEVAKVREKKLIVLSEIGIELDRYRDQHFVEKVYHEFKGLPFVLYVFIDNLVKLRDVFHSLPMRSAFFSKFQNSGHPVCCWGIPVCLEDVVYQMISKMSDVKLI